MGVFQNTSHISVTGPVPLPATQGPALPLRAAPSTQPSADRPTDRPSPAPGPASRLAPAPAPRHPGREGGREGKRDLARSHGEVSREALTGGSGGRCRPFPPAPPRRCGHGGAAGVSRPPQPLRAGPGPGRPRFGAQRDRPARGAAGRRPVPDGAEFRLVQLQVSARHRRAGEKLRGCDGPAVPVSDGAGGEVAVLSAPPPPGPAGPAPVHPLCPGTAVWCDPPGCRCHPLTCKQGGCLVAAGVCYRAVSYRTLRAGCQHWRQFTSPCQKARGCYSVTFKSRAFRAFLLIRKKVPFNIWI